MFVQQVATVYLSLSGWMEPILPSVKTGDFELELFDMRGLIYSPSIYDSYGRCVGTQRKIDFSGRSKGSAHEHMHK